MKYKDKSFRIREMMYEANGVHEVGHTNTRKWRDLDDLCTYLKDFGCDIKHEKRRRKGYLVVHLYNMKGGTPVCAELSLDFAEKVLALGGFP
jgi:hypothetical protein